MGPSCSPTQTGDPRGKAEPRTLEQFGAHIWAPRCALGLTQVRRDAGMKAEAQSPCAQGRGRSCTGGGGAVSEQGPDALTSPCWLGGCPPGCTPHPSAQEPPGLA